MTRAGRRAESHQRDKRGGQREEGRFIPPQQRPGQAREERNNDERPGPGPTCLSLPLDDDIDDTLAGTSSSGRLQQPQPRLQLQLPSMSSNEDVVGVLPAALAALPAVQRRQSVFYDLLTVFKKPTLPGTVVTDSHILPRTVWRERQRDC